MRRFAKAAALPLLLVLSLTFGTRGGVLQVPTSTWVPAANLLAARADSTATLLQDGRVLIAGGADANGAALATAEFFGADGSVNAAAPMNFARTRHFAVALQDGRVLVGGGMGANGMPMFSAEIFDPIANAWTPAGSGMVEARAGAAAGLLPDGRVAISGGDSGTLPSMTMEIFDPVSSTFALTGTMSAPRTKHAMAVLRDGRVMMFGGWNGSAILQTTAIFDPASGQMAPGPQMLAARMSHTATTALTGPVVIAGGSDGKNDLNTVEIFDPATGAFAAGPNLAAARQGQLAVLLPNNNNILFVGGTAAGAVVANAEMYSPWQGAMTAAGANAIARSKAAAAGTGADGVLLVSGGADANGAALNGNELYGFATVKTDAADYAPGTTVTITGKGWAPGETVTLTLVESPLVDTHPVMTEVADANGNFVNTDFSPDTHDLNIRFFLTAVGSNSGSQAMNTFTDAAAANVEFSTTGLPAATSVTVNWTGTNNGGHAINGPTTFGAPGPTAQIGVGPNTSFSYSFPSSIVTGSGTFNLVTASPASPFNTGAGNTLTNVTAAYAPAATATTAAVTSSVNPSNYGQSVTFTAKVAPASGSTAPTGSVQFKIDGVNSGSPVAVSACAPSPDACATLNSSTLAAGNHTVEADFTGTGLFTNSSGTLSGGQDVNKATLTASIIGDPTKPYTGDATATLTSANFSLSGLVGTDSFTVTKTSGTYNSKDVAAANTVTASLSAGDFTPNGGTLASNYTLPTTASGPGHITALTLTAAIIGDPTRPYNGNANATLTAANFSLSGLNGTDSFTVTKTSGTYNTKDVATANTVTASLAAGDFTANGTTVATNYSLPTSASGPGHITAVTLTAAIIGDPTRPYNGNANATLTAANFSLSGLVGTESFTITQTAGTYNSANVTAANSVSASLAAGDFTPGNGADAGNYVLPTTASGPGHITAVTLTAAIIGDPTKFFDGNANATLTPANFSITGLISPESISVTQSVGSYDSANTSATTVTAALAPGNFSAGAGTLLSNYNLPTTASGPGTIKPDVTTTGVSSSVNPSIFGQSVTFTATVTDTSTAATPTGSVQFVIDGVNYGSPVALSGATNSATGTVMTAAVSVNGSPHSVSANFVNADGNFINSNGALSGGQTVNPAPTSTSVSSSANPSVFGQSITFTATVTNTAGAGVSTATPTGSVQFIVDGVNFGSPVAVSGSGGISSATSVSTSNLNVNGSPHTVKAVFTDSDNNFSGSMNTLAGGQTVTKASTSTAVQSSLNPSIFGQSVTFTATVTNTSTGATPTGSVQFVVDGVNFGSPVALAGSGNSATATSSATATLTVPGSPHSIVANYSNIDGNFSTSSGNTTQTVTKAATSTTVSSSGSPSTLHQNVTFTATVVDSTPMSTGTPTGTVNFYDGVNPIGSGTLNGAGVATFSTTTLAVGTHSITAQYAGDVNFTGSTSSAISQVVQYNFCLVYDPTRSVKSGATYPIKIYACDASGADVSSSSIVVHATLVTQISGFSGAPDDAGNANPDNDFRFDITLGPSGGYIFNLKTSGLPSGTYMLNFTATNDPITHSATFGVK